MDIGRSTIKQKICLLIGSHLVTNKDVLERVKKLHIPPNWKNVKISSDDTSYLQATGEDAKGSMQYIYHPIWIELSKIEKYNRLSLFVKRLPFLIKQISKKLSHGINLSDKEYIIALFFEY